MKTIAFTMAGTMVLSAGVVTHTIQTQGAPDQAPAVATASLYAHAAADTSTAAEKQHGRRKARSLPFPL